MNEWMNAGCFIKEAIDSFFLEHFNGNYENGTYVYFAEVIQMTIWILQSNMTSYFHVDSIAKMLTARRLLMVLQHIENHVKKSLHFQLKKSFDLTKNG